MKPIWTPHLSVMHQYNVMWFPKTANSQTVLRDSRVVNSAPAVATKIQSLSLGILSIAFSLFNLCLWPSHPYNIHTQTANSRAHYSLLVVDGANGKRAVLFVHLIYLVYIKGRSWWSNKHIQVYMLPVCGWEVSLNLLCGDLREYNLRHSLRSLNQSVRAVKPLTCSWGLVTWWCSSFIYGYGADESNRS